MLDLQASVYLRLNESGRALWDRLAQSSSPADLEQVLVDQFGVDESHASEDAADFVEMMRTRQLLEP